MVGKQERTFMTSTRYVAGDLNSNFVISPHFSIGFYYTYSRALDPYEGRNTHLFLTALPLPTLIFSTIITLEYPISYII